MTKELLYKVVVVGDENVGKTSLIRRYCEGKFETSRVATIGVDFYTKEIPLPKEKVKLSIWDMAGQVQFKVVREGLYRGSRATALIYDVTNEESLPNLVAWREEVLSVVPNQRFVVVGNKIDLERVQNPDVARVFASTIEAPYLETSALTGEGVDQLFLSLANLAHEV